MQVTLFERPIIIRSDYWIYSENPAPTKEWTDRGGKWLLFVPWKKLDATWALIKKETEQGLLGVSAKAATAKQNGLVKNPWVKVICVYTYDSVDVEDVKRVRNRLRELGFTKKLSYKTDQATHEGRYAHNSDTPISLYYE